MDVLSFTVLAEGVTPLPKLDSLVDTAALAAGISTFVPLLVALITKREASDRVKSLVNLLAVAVASVIALFMNNTAGQPITWQQVSSTFLAGLIASVVALKGVWKPLQITPTLAKSTEDFGLGQPVAAQTEVTRP